MQGQWIGKFAGSNNGQILVDCDQVGDHYEGYAFVKDDVPTNPNSFVEFSTPDLSTKFALQLPVRVIDPNTSNPGDWHRVATHYPGFTFPAHADVTFELVGGRLNIDWKTNIGTFGSASLPPGQAAQPSILQPVPGVTNWAEFREHVRQFEPHKFIFRGQQDNRWRLRTGFHRTGRTSLARYYQQDIQTLWRYFSSIVTPHFNINDPLQYAAFVSLAQHHGFPTPLLDWTYSPFVAAYFAYRGVRNSVAKVEPPSRKVRILMFNKFEWLNSFNQVPKLAPLPPHFTILEPLAIANPRMIPQQALLSLTNIDDIEDYIHWAEGVSGKELLQVIDLPVQERPGVMSDLSIMGVAAGSLLPGLDGTCEELKERFYDL
jgi:hypothetical protein